MQPDRYRLHDGALMKKLMARAPGGRSLHVRDLATRVGLSRSKVSGLLTGTRPQVDESTARRIAEELGVHTDALFDPPTSTSVDVDVQAKGHMPNGSH